MIINWISSSAIVADVATINSRWENYEKNKINYKFITGSATNNTKYNLVVPYY